MTGLEKTEAYEIEKHEDLPDIHAEGYLLRHRKTGARVVLIPCEDDNKVFNIAFRTPPADSTGVAHIIEHTVLCGSEKYPLKDPFVELIKGSLNTFLNAMTYPDKTMYPVASTNDKDFRNLMGVYLDAVFCPNMLREEKIFRQEGWHYELESPDAPVTLNGVVYNELTGVFSSADDVLERETMNALFPDTQYGVESGGDPEVIPDLTYEAYLDFHRRYYHPSNSYIFLYGDMDMAETLAYIDSAYLSRFERLEIDSSIKTQTAFSSMKRIEKTYPISDEEEEEENTYLSFNAVAGDPLNIQEMIAFGVLDYALLSMPGAPVKQALLDAGIGKDIYGGYIDGILQPYFNIVSKNADPGDEEQFIETIRKVLAEQAGNGIDRNSLEAAISYLEFQFREADFMGYPKGLMYSINLFGTWLYHDDLPFEALKQLSAYENLRKLAGEGYFEQLIREKILDNPHKALIVLKPEKGLLARREQKTADDLAAYKASLSDEEISRLVRETEELHAWQEEPDPESSVETLPRLSRGDIRPEARRYSNEEGIIKAGDAEVPVVWHTADSNGIGYAELLFDASKIAEEDIPYLGLLKSVLVNVNAGGRSYMELNNEINMKTGGMSASLMVLESRDQEGYQAYMALRTKALYPRMKDAMTLMSDVLFDSDLSDGKRIREILMSTRSQLQAGMQTAGHAVAVQRAAAYYSSLGAFSDRTGGIAWYRFIKDLEDHYEEKEAEIRSKLEGLMKELFTAENLIVSYTSEREGREVLLDAAPVCIRPSGVTKDSIRIAPYGNLREGFTTSGQIQFVAMAGSFRGKGFAYSGNMQILRTLLSFEYLWQQVRVKGGAYGCSGAVKRTGDGVFTSYRDPNLRKTKETFLGIPEFLRHFTADEKLMTKYIIGTISGMDTPLTPNLYGMTSMRCWLTGVTDEDAQKTRDSILTASDEDIRKMADAVEAILRDDCFCVIGGSAIEKDPELFDHIEGLL